MMHWIAERKLAVVLTVIAVLLVTVTVLFSCVTAWRSVPKASEMTNANPITAPFVTTASAAETTTIRTIVANTQNPERYVTTPPETSPPTTTEKIGIDDKNRPVVSPGSHHFSHIIVFTDIQRVVLFTTPERGNSIPEIAFSCSTGAAETPSPITPLDRPFYLTGAGRLLEMWDSPCWVRYTTQIYRGYYFHSVPYEINDEVFDPSKMSIASYNKLGQNAASHGCVRLSLRDARFVYENTYKGMPVFILNSSKAFDLPDPQPLPKVKKGGLYRGWDPTDPDGPYNNKDFKKYTVTYDGNGSDAGQIPKDEKSPYFESAPVFVKGAGTMSKTGFLFVGWKLNGAGKMLVEGDFFRISRDVKLVAQWEKSTEPTTVPTTAPVPTTVPTTELTTEPTTEPSESTAAPPNEPQSEQNIPEASVPETP